MKKKAQEGSVVMTYVGVKGGGEEGITNTWSIGRGL